MTTLLHIRGLHVELLIDGALRPVIHDTTLSLDEGEALGLVGESGAGKSITVRAIMRLLPPGATVTGEILFDGAEVLDFDREALRRFQASDAAMIFQDPTTHINPVRRIGDFLTEALVTNNGMPEGEAEQLVVGILEDVGIGDAARRLKQYPHELSGGLLQRVMIAAALAIKPRLLLADEPTTSLDVTTQAEVMAILDEQRRQRGLGMIFVTHDLELAAAVCDRIAVMYAGFVVEDRGADSLHEQARHPYTAGLLASRPSPTERALRLSAIPGRPLAAFEVEAGCPFASRCPFVEERCEAEKPQLRELDGGRVRCHRAEELRGQLTSRSEDRRMADRDQSGVTALSEATPPARPPDGDDAVRVEGLTRVFGGHRRAADTTAVKEVSFAVAPGGALAIVGESGSGKTTTARMIIGLERPTAGRIFVGGRERTFGRVGSGERRRLGREMQIVFQDPYSSLDPRQRVRECLDEMLRLHFRLDPEERAARILELLAQVGLDERHAGVYPRALSGGQQQRVAIARALASQPRVLILDEAVASLDVSVQAQVLNLLADIREQTGVTYLFISHDLAVVRQVSDDVLVMRRGEIVERGPTDRVLDAPEHPYTQALLLAVPRRGWRPVRTRLLDAMSADLSPVSREEEVARAKEAAAEAAEPPAGSHPG